MEISITKDVLPVLAFGVAYITIAIGSIGAFFNLVSDGNPKSGKMFLICLGILASGSLMLYLLNGGRFAL